MTVRTILRLIAVVTILVGTILLMMSLVGFVGASRAMDGAVQQGLRLTEVATEFGLFALLSQAVIVGEGLLLWLLSPMLASRILELRPLASPESHAGPRRPAPGR
ncbi:MAG: hypothetical protein WAT39_03795 [Planctomycetota bacterium]